MILHPNGLRYGTIRRAPMGFAHAVLLDQGGKPLTWLIIDVYGAIPGRTLGTDEEVAGWPVVYEPMDDGVWELMWREHAKAGAEDG